MPDLLQKVSAKYVKPKFTDVKSGDTVRVYTTVTEGSKTRTQYFEGLVIRRRGGVGPDASFTVRRIASGVGTERTFPLHSPVITDIKIVRGAKVRRAQLHYMRERAGKSARLKEQPVKQADRDTDHPWLSKAEAAKAEAAQPTIKAEKSKPKTAAEKAADKAEAAGDKPAAGKDESAPAESKGTTKAKADAKADAKPKTDAKAETKPDNKPAKASKKDDKK
jgi:large subunit ribosomal protein L19